MLFGGPGGLGGGAGAGGGLFQNKALGGGQLVVQFTDIT